MTSISSSSKSIVVYCNGICADGNKPAERGNLQSQMGLLKTIFGNHEVALFNNPTGVAEYCSHSKTDKALEERVVTQFVEFLRQFTSKVPSQRILLIAHSHGALITRLALTKLTIHESDCIEVCALGGVTMIPKALARKVHNYVCVNDVISREGNEYYDHLKILDKTVRACESNRLEGSLQEGFKQALMNLFMSDLHRELHQNRSYSGEYAATFWSGKPDAVNFPKDQWAQYSACFAYNITLLRPDQKETDSTVPDDPKELEQLLVKQVANYGMHIDSEYHKLSVFKQLITKVATAFFDSGFNDSSSREVTFIQSISIARRTLEKCQLEIPGLQKLYDETKAAYTAFGEERKNSAYYDPSDIGMQGLPLYVAYSNAEAALKKAQQEMTKNREFLEMISNELTKPN